MQSVPVFAHVKYSTEEKKIDLDNSKLCKNKGDGYYKLGDTTACFTGDFFENNSIDQLLKDINDNRIKTLHLDSAGGEVVKSIEIARKIRKTKIKLVVHNYCFSSCANYMLPAAHVLVIQKNAVLGMHGSLPRSSSFYVRTLSKARGVLGKSKKPTPESMEVVINALKEYPQFYRNLVVKENEFFLDMQVSEQYLTRYFELQRNSDIYDSGKCGSIPPVTLIIGPQYFKQFYRGNLLEFDWDSETLVETEIFKFLAGKFSIVMDNELLPSRTPTIKKLDKTLCFQGL